MTATIAGHFLVSVCCGCAAWLIVSNVWTASQIGRLAPPAAARAWAELASSDGAAWMAALDAALYDGGWLMAAVKMNAALLAMWLSLASSPHGHVLWGWLAACSPSSWLRCGQPWREAGHAGQGGGAGQGGAQGAARRPALRPSRARIRPTALLMAQLTAANAILSLVRLGSRMLDGPYLSHNRQLAVQMAGPCLQHAQPVRDTRKALQAAPWSPFAALKQMRRAIGAGAKGSFQAGPDGSAKGTGARLEGSVYESMQIEDGLGYLVPMPSVHGDNSKVAAPVPAGASGAAPGAVVPLQASAAQQGKGGQHGMQALCTFYLDNEASAGRAAVPPHWLLRPVHLHDMSSVARAARLWTTAPSVIAAKMKLQEVVAGLQAPLEGIRVVLNNAMRTHDGLDILALVFLGPFALAIALLVLAMAMAGIHVLLVWLHLALPPALYAVAVLGGLTISAYRLAEWHREAVRPMAQGRGSAGARQASTGGRQGQAQDRQDGHSGITDGLLAWARSCLPCRRAKLCPLADDDDEPDHIDGRGHGIKGGWQVLIRPYPGTNTTNANSSLSATHGDQGHGHPDLCPVPSAHWRSTLVTAGTGDRFTDVCCVCLEPFVSKDKGALQQQQGQVLPVLGVAGSGVDLGASTGLGPTILPEGRGQGQGGQHTGQDTDESSSGGISSQVPETIHSTTSGTSTSADSIVYAFTEPVCVCDCSHALHLACMERWNGIRAQSHSNASPYPYGYGGFGIGVGWEGRMTGPIAFHAPGAPFAPMGAGHGHTSTGAATILPAASGVGLVPSAAATSTVSNIGSARQGRHMPGTGERAGLQAAASHQPPAHPLSARVPHSASLRVDRRPVATARPGVRSAFAPRQGRVAPTTARESARAAVATPEATAAPTIITPTPAPAVSSIVPDVNGLEGYGMDMLLQPQVQAQDGQGHPAAVQQNHGAAVQGSGSSGWPMYPSYGADGQLDTTATPMPHEVSSAGQDTGEASSVLGPATGTPAAGVAVYRQLRTMPAHSTDSGSGASQAGGSFGMQYPLPASPSGITTAAAAPDPAVLVPQRPVRGAPSQGGHRASHRPRLSADGYSSDSSESSTSSDASRGRSSDDDTDHDDDDGELEALVAAHAAGMPLAGVTMFILGQPWPCLHGQYWTRAWRRCTRSCGGRRRPARQAPPAPGTQAAAGRAGRGSRRESWGPWLCNGLSTVTTTLATMLLFPVSLLAYYTWALCDILPTVCEWLLTPPAGPGGFGPVPMGTDTAADRGTAGAHTARADRESPGLFSSLTWLWECIVTVLCPCRTRPAPWEGPSTKCPACRAEVATIRITELQLVRMQQ